MKKRFRFIIPFFLFPTLCLASETIVSQREHALVRLIPLDKITVGPDDQYHGSVDPGGESLVFTKKLDLVPHLCRQDLKTGEVADLLPLDADSQEASLGPDGRIAFVYYKYDARGNICYRAPAGSSKDKVTCLKSDEVGGKSFPFWKSSNELGFVLNDNTARTTKIIVEDLKTGARQVLAQGSLFSPAMKPGGRYLFYMTVVPNRGGDMEGPNQPNSRALTVLDLKSGTTKVVHFDLPGISGFPAVSDDEKELFFSHYLNDTNHDGVIDGDDNSVIFRVGVDKILQQGVVFPEQLTSAESNCSFPRPFGDRLFMTCAFEGALGVYSIPVSGIVPLDWNEQLLGSAHETARTYEERLLILNTVKYRFPNLDTKDLEQRLLSDDLLADDITAAKYYLSSVKAEGDSRGGFYSLLQSFLDARALKNIQPNPEEVTPAFRSQILSFDRDIQKQKGPARFKNILRGLLRTYLVQPKDSLAFLRKVRFDSGKADPLERYYYFELARWTLPRVKDTSGVSAMYRQMMTAPELSEESKIYYAFRFLEHVEATNKNIADRKQAIEKFNHDLPNEVSSLLNAEVATFAIIQAPTHNDKLKAYPALDKLLMASRTDYFLRKALYVRAILNFAAAAEFEFLNDVANAWLRFTSNKDTEFAYARQVVVNATLDRAYDAWGEKNWRVALAYFYGSLSLTDDLESHYGYILSMVKDGQRSVLETRYKNLANRQFISDNMKFVEALLSLIDDETAHSAYDLGTLNVAIEKLSAMTQDRDSPVRYLLLGYAQLIKLQQTANGYDFDSTLFADANRNLMLAYDLGRDNPRVQAAALTNLGLLNMRVQNYALAAQFLAKRKPLGFISSDQAADFAWSYSRALYYNHQADKAAEELSTALKLPDLPAVYDLPFRERLAFYLTSAGSYQAAADRYRTLLPRISGDSNLAKSNLAYGYDLFKLRKMDEARVALETAVVHAANLHTIPKGGARLIDLEPMRIELDAYGFLGQMGTPAQRFAALQKRGELLPKAKSLFDDEPSLELQNRLQQAATLRDIDPALAAQRLHEALPLIEKLGDSGLYLSHNLYQSTVDYLVYATHHRNLFPADDPAAVKRVVDKSIAAYTAQRTPQPMLEEQRAKLQALWSEYASHAGR